MQKKYLNFDSEIIVKADQDSRRRFQVKITSNAVDRDGEVLLPEGMITSDFDRNPVVFWNHNYDEPIAMSDVPMQRTKDGWMADATMNPMPVRDNGPRPDNIHELMKVGAIRGSSVGFMPIESRPANKKDIEQFGEGVKHVYAKWKLLEWSVTPLPANQDALIVGAKQVVRKGLLSPAAVKELVGVDVDLSCDATEYEQQETTTRVTPRTIVFFCSEETERKPVVPMSERVERAASIALAKKLGKSYL